MGSGTGVRRYGRDPAVQADCMARIALQRRALPTQHFPGINCGTRALSLLASGASKRPVGARDPLGTSLFREARQIPGFLGVLRV